MVVENQKHTFQKWHVLLFCAGRTSRSSVLIFKMMNMLFIINTLSFDICRICSAHDPALNREITIVTQVEKSV